MPIVRTGETEADRELERWNKPYVYAPFPRMLYRGVLKSNGQHDVEMLTVDTDADLRRSMADGWLESPVDAKRSVESAEQDIALAAAENAAAAQRMSRKAQRELSTREASTHRHVIE